MFVPHSTVSSAHHCLYSRNNPPGVHPSQTVHQTTWLYVAAESTSLYPHSLAPPVRLFTSPRYHVDVTAASRVRQAAEPKLQYRGNSLRACATSMVDHQRFAPERRSMWMWWARSGHHPVLRKAGRSFSRMPFFLHGFTATREDSTWKFFVRFFMQRLRLEDR